MFKYTKSLYKLFVASIVVTQAVVIGELLGKHYYKKIEKIIKKK